MLITETIFRTTKGLGSMAACELMGNIKSGGEMGVR